MKNLLVVVLAFALAGCSGSAKPLVVVPSADRLDWPPSSAGRMPYPIRRS
jgi:hypothetical protein